MELSELEAAIRQCWCRETSADPDSWSENNPPWGQCVVTALIVNDYLGGKLVWAEANCGEKKWSHYFNLLGGVEHDLTREQFPEGTVVPQGVDKTKGFSTTREYVLSFKQTVRRYELLRDRVEETLTE